MRLRLPLALLGAATLLAAGPTALSEADRPTEPVLRAAAFRTRLGPHPRPAGHQIAVVRPDGSVELHTSPGGKVLARLGDRTQFGSRQSLAVIKTRGRWLGVATSARQNGQLGWIERDAPGLRVASTNLWLEADLSRRTVALHDGKRAVRHFSVAVGRPGSETPTGRFGVTDKLQGHRFGPYYGCCVMALSGYQPHPPAGWRGGNRLGLHGTGSPGTIGRAASAGCLRASDQDLGPLMGVVRVGTTLVIHG